MPHKASRSHMHKLLVTTRIGRRADLVASGSSLGGRSQSRVGRAIFLSDFSSKVGLCEVSRLKAKRMLNFYGPSTTRARKNRKGKEGGGYIPMPVQWAHVTCSRHRQLFISGGAKTREELLTNAPKDCRITAAWPSCLPTELFLPAP